MYTTINLQMREYAEGNGTADVIPEGNWPQADFQSRYDLERTWEATEKAIRESDRWKEAKNDD